MRELPIIFSGSMIRAILAGRKTQTRRVISPQPAWDAVREEWTYEDRRGVSRWSGPMGPAACALHYGLLPSCPYGAPGDRLWVRETHAIVPATAYRQSTGVRQIEDPSDPDMAAIYREGWERSPPSRWRPSIYMPRWASRLLLEVEEVRVERLQAITDEDAQAEGAFWTDYGRRCYHDGQGDAETCPAPDEHHDLRPGWSMVETTSADQCLHTARMAFANLWNKINGKREGCSWEANPWVWVVSFRRVEVRDA